MYELVSGPLPSTLYNDGKKRFSQLIIKPQRHIELLVTWTRSWGVVDRARTVLACFSLHRGENVGVLTTFFFFSKISFLTYLK